MGKSTVAANLAIALRRAGAKVGLCDCDLYGPSIALMFGANERPTADDDNRIMLQMKSKLWFGSLNLYLKSYRPTSANQAKTAQPTSPSP